MHGNGFNVNAFLFREAHKPVMEESAEEIADGTPCKNIRKPMTVRFDSRPCRCRGKDVIPHPRPFSKVPQPAIRMRKRAFMNNKNTRPLAFLNMTAPPSSTNALNPFALDATELMAFLEALPCSVSEGWELSLQGLLPRLHFPESRGSLYSGDGKTDKWRSDSKKPPP